VGWRLADKPSWPSLLAGLALLGFLAMPIDYRGGAELPHTHALLQLLRDATDGHLQHAHASPAAVADSSSASSWFDPNAKVASSPHGMHHATDEVDPGQPQHSDSSYSGIPVLLVSAMALPIMTSARRAVAADWGWPQEHAPEVLSPPPQRHFAA
jgi:hypothetical protein